MATASTQTLKQRLTELVPEKIAEIKEVKAKYGKKSLGEVTVDMVAFIN